MVFQPFIIGVMWWICSCVCLSAHMPQKPQVTHLVTHLVWPHGVPSPWGLGLCRPCRIHKKPILVFLILSSLPLNELDATYIYCFLVQTIPSIHHSLWKKVSPDSLTLCFFFNLNVCPLVPLIFASLSNNSSILSLVNPLYILNTSVKSCLFRLSSNVHKFKLFNLSP